MDDKKTLQSFLAPDPDNDRNFWMMAQQRASAPNMAPGYRGFYPMFRSGVSPPGISPIRHILPQIPTRASNPRTAVSKASLREPFPNIPRSDPMFSSIVPGEPLSRDVIWREDYKDVSGREGLEQGELEEFNRYDLAPAKSELIQDMSMASVKSGVQYRDSDNSFDTENDFHKTVELEKEPRQKSEYMEEKCLSRESSLPGKYRAVVSSHKRNSRTDDRKDSYNSESDASDGSSFPQSSTKSREVATNPIKLKIRCDFKEGHKELMAIIGKDLGTKQESSAETTMATAAGPPLPLAQTQGQQPSPQGLGPLGLAPPSPQTFIHSAPVPSPSMNIVRPKTGRAKTNAELKKQLMEKRAVQYLKGQGDGGSQASSPATSHVDVSSPASVQADAPSPLSAQTEGFNMDILESPLERSNATKYSQEGKGKKTGSSGGGVECHAALLDQPQVETKWVVGDMLWARVSGHPWWPCIVSPDPFQHIYTKVISRGQKISFRQYHVQFFGEEGERGWVQESSAIPFEGRTKFENFCQEMLKEHKKDKKNYTVAPNRRRAWEIAVSAAEHARTMPRVRRIEEYVAVYEGEGPSDLPATDVFKDKESTDNAGKPSEDGAVKSKPQANVKQHRKSSIDDPLLSSRPSEASSPPRKKPKLTEPPAVESPSHIKLPKNISNQCIVQFTVFCQKRRESVKNEHPEYDDEQVEDCLQEQWSKLDDETRSRFIPMGSDFTYLSQMMAAVGMPKASGVKRSLRFVKTKKSSTSEKPEKQKRKESVMEVEKSSAQEETVPEEKRTPRRRLSVEQKPADVEPPRSRRSQNSVNGKAAEAEVSGLVSSPLNCASTPGIPFKKRGRRSKEFKSPSAEKMEQEDEKAEKAESAKKASVPVARKDTTPASKSFIGNDEDEDTEEELDDTNVCFICEKATKGIEQCQGPCHGFFHPSCLSQSSPVGGKFQCDECTTGVHKCFVCEKPGEKTVPCSTADCGRFYHEDCLKTVLPEGSLSLADRPLSCPLHTCFTCQLKKLDKGSVSDDDSDLTDLYVCVRCPTAYHMTDSCVSAGSSALTGKYIVCSKHFEPSKTHSLHTRTSSSWCFICEKGGNLLYCDCCPAAYHAACLEISVPPSGAWQCPDCSRGKTPLYGDLVWVKFGSYRWWPAEIYHPASLPGNIQDLSHQVGEFPVCFFGSHDYLWLHRGRVFPFKEGDKCCREADAKGTAKIFDKAMKEAIAVYRMLNPNSKQPSTNATNEESRQNPGLQKTKDDDDDDDVDDGSKKDDADDDDEDARARSRSSSKSVAASDRKGKRARVRSNSKALHQLRRQSRALRMIEVPRPIEDGQALQMVNDHENKCYRCGQVGQLILCDKPKCTKAYHLKCIHKSKLPHGMWLCPWHFCDICGKAAIQMCSRCPNSYCVDHISKNIVFTLDHGVTCFSHSDVSVDDESLDTTLQFVTLNASPGPNRSRSNDSTEAKPKKRRAKSVKKTSPSAATGRRTVATRRSVERGNDSDSRSDEGQLTIIEDVVAPVAKRGNSATKRSSRKTKPVSRSRKSEGSSRSRESAFSQRLPAPFATSRPDDSQLADGSAVSATGKSLVQMDSPMFDNSDDEFPQLVIDVPTL